MPRQTSTFERFCERCGVTFTSKASSLAKRSGARFCSHDCYHAASRIPVDQRFWKHVDQHGPPPPHQPQLGSCWLWTGTTLNKYGGLWVDGRYQGVHRVAYQMLVGPIPEGMVVMHLCDTPLCVRPDHLQPGTTQENNHDRTNKGRQLAGMRHPGVKVSDAAVAAIRRAYAAGVGRADLARQHGLSFQHVDRIVRNESRLPGSQRAAAEAFARTLEAPPDGESRQIHGNGSPDRGAEANGRAAFELETGAPEHS